MNAKNGLVLVYTGRKIMIERIKAELELEGIIATIRDGFRQGIEAGFSGGIPSAIDLFVTEEDEKKALEIIHELTKE